MSEDRVSARLSAITDLCTRCGDCLESCPTYVISGHESESPRGRIALIDAALIDPVTDADELCAHIDSCTSCMSCLSACPEQVRYDLLVPLARELAESRRAHDPAADAESKLILETVTHPWTLEKVAPLAALGARAGVRRLPQPLRALAETYPDLPPLRETRRPLPEFTAATGPRRGTVALLQGCSARVLHGPLVMSAITVLSAAGFDVIAPPSARCCGALHHDSADIDGSRQRARDTMTQLSSVGAVDAVVSTGAVCSAFMKGYGGLLGGTVARRFAGNVFEVCELLSSLPAHPQYGPLPITVAWHQSCSLSVSERQPDAGMKVLQQIPDLRIVQTLEPGLCCGAAGAYRIRTPDRAAQLGARRAEQLLATGAELICTAGAECVEQLSLHTRALGRELPVLHPVQLLSRALGNSA